MRAMVLETPGKPLRAMEMPVPRPGTEQVLIQVAPKVPVKTEVQIFPLQQANDALNSLR